MSIQYNKSNITKGVGSQKYDRATLAELIDIELIECHLGANIDQISELEKGYLNRKFILTSGESIYILKSYSDHLSFVSPKLNSEGKAKAEYQALKICESYNLGAPRPVGFFKNAVLMTQINGPDLTDLPLTKEVISLIVSWLLKFHSIEVTRNLLNIGVINAPLLGARQNLKRYISKHPDDILAPEIEGLLLNTLHSFPDSVVLLRGDPTLGNWIIKGKQIYGLDFEFFSAGNPLFEIGLFLVSILDHGRFSEMSFEYCRYALTKYLEYNSAFSLEDLKLGTLCGLILVAVSVPNQERCHRIFNHTPKTLGWIENLRGLS